MPKKIKPVRPKCRIRNCKRPAADKGNGRYRVLCEPHHRKRHLERFLAKEQRKYAARKRRLRKSARKNRRTR